MSMLIDKIGKMSIFALLSGNCTDLIKVLIKKRVLNALKGHLYRALTKYKEHYKE